MKLKATFISECEFEITEEEAEEIEDEDRERDLDEIVPDFWEDATAYLELDDYEIIKDED